MGPGVSRLAMAAVTLWRYPSRDRPPDPRGWGVVGGSRTVQWTLALFDRCGSGCAEVGGQLVPVSSTSCLACTSGRATHCVAGGLPGSRAGADPPGGAVSA